MQNIPDISIIIPARYGSERFPGKPLAKIAGITMLERVWKATQNVKNVASVYITSDDNRVLNHAVSIGAKVIGTSPECKNGTERVYAASRQLQNKPDFIINFQGDAPHIPPFVLQTVVNEIIDSFNSSYDLKIVTPMVKLNLTELQKLKDAKSTGEVSGTTVVFDKNNYALYFSKLIIPFVRNKVEDPPVYRHIGIYGYSFETLNHYVNLTPGILEQSEGLEQLRFLENGIPIKLVSIDFKGRSHTSGVDTPEDILRVEELLKSEGEFL